MLLMRHTEILKKPKNSRRRKKKGVREGENKNLDQIFPPPQGYDTPNRQRINSSASSSSSLHPRPRPRPRRTAAIHRLIPLGVLHRIVAPASMISPHLEPPQRCPEATTTTTTITTYPAPSVPRPAHSERQPR